MSLVVSVVSDNCFGLVYIGQMVLEGRTSALMTDETESFETSVNIYDSNFATSVFVDIAVVTMGG